MKQEIDPKLMKNLERELENENVYDYIDKVDKARKLFNSKEPLNKLTHSNVLCLFLLSKHSLIHPSRPNYIPKNSTFKEIKQNKRYRNLVDSIYHIRYEFKLGI